MTAPSRHAAFWARLEARKPEAAMALGLDRIRNALAAVGAPDERFSAVIVAGTNGKGSTARLIEAQLLAAGRRVGGFYSPHVWQPSERIRIAGAEVEEDQLVAELAAHAARFAELTYFELFFLAAATMFARAQVEVAVLEVGLGGRLDATNAVRRVAATAIVSIGLDHTAILGPDAASIAAEKAGILRPGVPLWTGPLAADAEAVVAARAAAVGAPRRPTPAPLTPQGWRGPAYLAANLGLAHAVARHVEPHVAAPGAELFAQLPFGRWTVLCHAPRKVVDGAHNGPGAAAAAAAAAQEVAAPPEIWLQIGRSKDAAQVIEALRSTAAQWVLIDADPDAWWTPAELEPYLGAALRRSVPADKAPAAFFAAAHDALWVGTLRGLGPLAAYAVSA